MVEKIENLFDALHQIILMFFFKLAVFSPALTNAALVGFAIGSFAHKQWGWIPALISGIVAAFAIETAGVILSWRMRQSSQWLMISLYIVGSWILVWFGLNEGVLTNMVGFIMPVFAVAVQWTIAKEELEKANRKRIEAEKIEEQARVKKEAEEAFERTLKESRLETERLEQQAKLEIERTKQEKAKARAAKAQNLTQNDAKMSKNEAKEWLLQNTNIPSSVAASELGVTPQTIRNYRKELEQETFSTNGKGQHP